MITDRTSAMRAIKEEVMALATSPLYDERIRTMSFPVIGEGSHTARVMFVGEAPGKNEAATGRPFCGASGRVLDELLEHVGLVRRDVYITNVVKDRPPGNRDPRPEEIELYAPFLDRQIQMIKPRVIVTLGRFSMEYLLCRVGLAAQVDKISRMRGRVFEAQMPYGAAHIVPMFHPAVGVYNRTSIPQLKGDMEILKTLLA